MSTVWDKLFASRQAPANDAEQSPFRYDIANETVPEPGPAAGGFAERPGADFAPKSQKVARTFDSIGRRNEALRAHLDAVEMSFRNIDAIRAQFHETLLPIDQTLGEIERTKTAHAEAERKLEELGTNHERLKTDHSGLALERNALALKQDEFKARVADLERAITAAESASSEARSTLAERTAKLERVERELDDNRRRLQTVSDQLPAIRSEFATKEKRLQEVEQHRATLSDQHDLLVQENRTLRARIEEFVASASKLNRQLSELESRRDELARRLEEVEASLAQEAAAHAKLKASHLDAAEAHRLSLTNLRDEHAATISRLEAAERLLAEARAGLRERDAAIRGFEQRALEASLAVKSKETHFADLEKDLASLRAAHMDVDAARAAAVDRSAMLAKSLENREISLQRAEHRIESLEAGIAEQNSAALSERNLYEEKTARLKEQLEAEVAARAFAEGALQTARQERGGRRQEAETEPARETPAAAHGETAREKVARLRP